MLIRPFSADDIQSVVGLLKRTLTADPLTESVFEERVLLDPNFDANGALVAVDENRVVGFALGIARKAQLENQASDLDKGWITLIAVEETQRRKGIGRRLLSDLTAYFARERVKSIWVSPYAPNYFTPGVDLQAYPGAVEFFKEHGFLEMYCPLSMDASLLTLPHSESIVRHVQNLAAKGIRIEAFEPKHILALTAFMKEEFPGDWQRCVRETMSAIVRGDGSPEHLWVAMRNGAALGFTRHEGERFGPLGVAETARGNGIGAALLFTCLDSMRNRGLQNAWLMWTDDATAQLYRKAGFAETRRYVVMRKALD